MKYPYLVVCGGKEYPAGTEVPENDATVATEDKEEKSEREKK